MADNRVWDSFLTERDKQHLASGGKPARGVGFGQTPVLLMIDLYRAVFGDQPQPLLEAIKEWPSSCGLDAWEALPHIQSLLAAAREAGIPVVHVTPVNLQGAAARRHLGAGNRVRHDRMNDVPNAEDKKRRRSDIIDELAPIPGEAHLHKAAASAFFGSAVPSYLSGLDADTIIVAGESTSGCVRASVVDGAAHRYRMIVVEDCVFDRHQLPHAASLFDMNQKYADVLPLAEVLSWMEAWEPAEEPVDQTTASALAG